MRNRRHPAARTRRGLALGTVVATAGLTGAWWVSELATTTTAASPSSSSSSSSIEDQSTSTFDDDTSSSFDDDVDVTPSVSAPITSSRAS